MKIIVLHGDDVDKSGQRLQKFADEAKKRKWEVVRILPDSTSLKEMFNVQSLFGNERFVILEDPIKLLAPDKRWLMENYPILRETLIIYHTKTLSKAYLNSLPKIDKIETFELPKLLWKFLDAFYPGNVKSVLTLLYQTSESEAVELIFSMLARHLKDLYHVSISPETMSIPPWRMLKLQTQALRFGESGLKEIIKSMVEIDITVKTSNENLQNSLDFLICTYLS